ncbi:hypothetical protein GQ457_15G021600 [Hibiscus cannabinus]
MVWLEHIYNLMVESECSNLVSWLRQPSMTPFAFKEIVSNCLVVARNLNWELVLVDRDKNAFADRLEKAGIDLGAVPISASE